MLRFREIAVSRGSSPRIVAERQYGMARGIAAATMVHKILRNMRAHSQAMRCTGLLTNTLFNSLLFFLVEGHLPGQAVRDDARHKYTLCLNQLYEFGQLWVSASLVHRLFEALQGSLLQGSLFPGRSVELRGLGPSRSPGYGHPLFPGVPVSSDLTQADTRQLIETEFHYDEPMQPSSAPSSMAGLSAATSQADNTSLSVWLPSPENVWSGVEQTQLGGFPATLDVDTWCV